MARRRRSGGAGLGEERGVEGHDWVARKERGLAGTEVREGDARGTRRGKGAAGVDEEGVRFSPGAEVGEGGTRGNGAWKDTAGWARKRRGLAGRKFERAALGKRGPERTRPEWTKKERGLAGRRFERAALGERGPERAQPEWTKKG
ncbi:hypothetical protein GCM10017566_38340 [Amycolatopsis bartoniae]|uniref:Uncharacterized protein n=1 Tax=Amycolatopsis bartoniae TaxID=941986 RepID=A0A8H9MB01_9PSEU|nr:hypothetical protein GCM10017566_38340 [Amycolatopsis bartoniae]